MSFKTSIVEPDKCVKSLANLLRHFCLQKELPSSVLIGLQMALEQWGEGCCYGHPQGTSGFMEMLCSSGDMLEKKQPLEPES